MFGLRAWPTPIVKPLWPFMIAGVVTVYGIAKLQDVAVSTPEALADPKNPFAASKAKAAAQAAH